MKQLACQRARETFGADRSSPYLLGCGYADLGECTRNSATAVMRVPAEFGNPSTCFMHAQAYLAQTSFGQDLGANERVKIICVRSETVAASTQS